MRTAIIVCVLSATTTETDAGASQNIARTAFIAIRAVGFATPMGTGVITSTLAGSGIRIGSTTTATGTDKHLDALGPVRCGAQMLCRRPAPDDATSPHLKASSVDRTLLGVAQNQQGTCRRQ